MARLKAIPESENLYFNVVSMHNLEEGEKFELFLDKEGKNKVYEPKKAGNNQNFYMKDEIYLKYTNEVKN